MLLNDNVLMSVGHLDQDVSNMSDGHRNVVVRSKQLC